MFHRLIKISTTRSFFLFGARGTGKSTLLRHRLSLEQAVTLDLLLPGNEARYARNPELLLGFIAMNPGKTIIIDEVQRVPKLLDIVHGALSEGRATFILTGSSARKLKRGGSNLLAGRASVKELFPLTSLELEKEFVLDDALNWGTLPEIFSIATAEEKRDFLMAYAQTYLKEEVAAEQLVRKIDSFRGFLEVAAQSNAKLINATRIGKEVGIDTKTVQTYFSILEETHLGFLLEQYHRSARKRVMAIPKFYFFDLGVARALAQTVYSSVTPGTSYYGECFEQFIVCETHRLASYANRGQRLFMLVSQDGFEIDLIIETPGAPLCVCEIKSAASVERFHMKNLLLAKGDFPPDTLYFVVSNDRISRVEDGVHCMHWMDFLKHMFKELADFPSE